MLLSSPDDPALRPVGAADPKRRLLSLRHIVMALAVLIVGGGGGTAAYFLADMDLRELIGFLDVADPGGPKLTMLLPAPDGAAPAAVSAVPGDLLTPPGGAVQRPEPVAIAPPLPIAAPPPLPIAVPQEPAKGAEAHGEAAKPATEPAGGEKPFDAKLFSGIMVPPPVATATAVPPPAPRPVDKIPSLTDLPELHPAPALSPAPEKALLGNSAHGPLPVVSADGRQPWKVYARPFDGPKTQPRLALVVANLGLDLTNTELLINRLPPDVTLAFSPYALELARWLKQARDTGHETLIMLPVASDAPGAGDPGPLGLNQTLSDRENMARLEIILSRAPGVVGVLVPTDAFFTHGNSSPLLAALLQRGVLFVGPTVHGLRNPPVAVISDVIDRSPWKSAIDARLALALANSRSQREQVLVVSPRPVALATALPWLDGLAEQGVALAPVSAVGAMPK